MTVPYPWKPKHVPIFTKKFEFVLIHNLNWKLHILSFAKLSPFLFFLPSTYNIQGASLLQVWSKEWKDFCCVSSPPRTGYLLLLNSAALQLPLLSSVNTFMLTASLNLIPAWIHSSCGRNALNFLIRFTHMLSKPGNSQYLHSPLLFMGKQTLEQHSFICTSSLLWLLSAFKRDLSRHFSNCLWSHSRFSFDFWWCSFLSRNYSLPAFFYICVLVRKSRASTITRLLCKE